MQTVRQFRESSGQQVAAKIKGVHMLEILEDTQDDTNTLDACVDLGDTPKEDAAYSGKSYKVSTTANDFNVSTIFSYFKSGAFEIPPFQRNYVWDIRKASKLIESLIIGLPVPQVFLWQKEKSKLSIIDGQQRMSSIYFYLSGRFPRAGKVAEIRKRMRGVARLSDEILQDDALFGDFKLTFSKGYNSPYAGEKYSTLDEDVRAELDLRPLRSITVKQEDPQNNDSMYEIFNRLNTGGVNLKPQEIRMSLNHSDFFDMLSELNEHPLWRNLIKMDDFDKHARDVELLTRAFAMLVYSEKYSSNSMVQFLNNFSEAIDERANSRLPETKRITQKYDNNKLKTLFVDFLAHCESIGTNHFYESGKLVFPLLEACFHAAYFETLPHEKPKLKHFTATQVQQILTDTDFATTREKATNNTTNVDTRLKVARRIICG